MRRVSGSAALAVCTLTSFLALGRGLPRPKERERLIVLVEECGLAGGARVFLLYPDGRLILQRDGEVGYRSFVVRGSEKRRILSVLLSDRLWALGGKVYGLTIGDHDPGKTLILRRGRRSVTFSVVGFGNDRCVIEPPAAEKAPSVPPNVPRVRVLWEWTDVPDVFVDACELIEKLRYDARAAPLDPEEGHFIEPRQEPDGFGGIHP